MKPTVSWPYDLPRSGNDPISFAIDHLDLSIFREYDLRGTIDAQAPSAEFPLNEFVANRLGRAFGTYLVERGSAEIVVGHDSRSYSERLATAMAVGLLSTGMHVHFIGLAPTPTVYFAQHHLGGICGVAVTASHNPNGWAGFKLSAEPSTTLGPDELAQLRAITESREFATGSGTYSEHIIIPDYVSELARLVPMGGRRLRVVVDGGNSVSGPVLEQALSAAGYDVVTINRELDWEFPNHEPDPEAVAARVQIAAAITEHSADVGLSIDGDGDRLGVTDEKGAIVWSDVVLALLAIDTLTRHPGSSIVYDVKCSRVVADVISEHGGVPIMWKTGHSHIKAKARELKAPLSGERSGHFFDAGDYYGYDDAVYAGLRVARILSQQDARVSDVIGRLPQYASTPTMHAHCADDAKYEVVDRLLGAAATLTPSPHIIDVNGVRAEWDDGWFLVRASSNLPALVIVIEATNGGKLRELYEVVRTLLRAETEVAGVWENDPFAASG